MKMGKKNYEIWYEYQLLIEAETLDFALREAFDASKENSNNQVFIWKNGVCISAVQHLE
jgi:hypothetical protein